MHYIIINSFFAYLIRVFHLSRSIMESISLRTLCASGWALLFTTLLKHLQVTGPSALAVCIHSRVKRGALVKSHKRLTFPHRNFESKCDLLHLPTWVCSVVPVRGAETILASTF